VPVPGRAPTASACEPYRELIGEGLRRGRNAMGIWQDLVDGHGFTGPSVSVRRFVCALRGAATPERSGIITTAVVRKSLRPASHKSFRVRSSVSQSRQGVLRHPEIYGASAGVSPHESVCRPTVVGRSLRQRLGSAHAWPTADRWPSRPRQRAQHWKAMHADQPGNAPPPVVGGIGGTGGGVIPFPRRLRRPAAPIG